MKKRNTDTVCLIGNSASQNIIQIKVPILKNFHNFEYTTVLTSSNVKYFEILYETPCTLEETFLSDR